MAEIAVHADKDVAPGGTEPGDHRRAEAALAGPDDHPHPVEPKRRDRFDAAVLTVVVDEDDIEIGQVVLPNPRDALDDQRNVPDFPVGRNDDADARRTGMRARSPSLR